MSREIAKSRCRKGNTAVVLNATAHAGLLIAKRTTVYIQKLLDVSHISIFLPSR